MSTPDNLEQMARQAACGSANSALPRIIPLGKFTRALAQARRLLAEAGLPDDGEPTAEIGEALSLLQDALQSGAINDERDAADAALLATVVVFECADRANPDAAWTDWQYDALWADDGELFPDVLAALVRQALHPLQPFGLLARDLYLVGNVAPTSLPPLFSALWPHCDAPLAGGEAAGDAVAALLSALPGAWRTAFLDRLRARCRRSAAPQAAVLLALLALAAGDDAAEPLQRLEACADDFLAAFVVHRWRAGAVVDALERERLLDEQLGVFAIADDRGWRDAPCRYDRFLERSLYLAERSRVQLLRQQHDAAERRAEHEQALARQALAAERARAEAQQQTLSALTHTLHNALSTAPELVRHALGVLGAAARAPTPGETRALNNLASLYATFEFTERLIRTFKLYVTDPQKLVHDAHVDEPGLPSVAAVVLGSLRQALTQVVFSAGEIDSLERLLDSGTSDAVRRVRAAFRADLLAVDPEQAPPAALPHWVAAYLPRLRIELGDGLDALPLRNRTQHALLFTMASELMLNAIRHADRRLPIRVSLAHTDDGVELRVENSCADLAEARRGQLEQGFGGLAFVRRLASPELSDVAFEWSQRDRVFLSRLLIRHRGTL